METVKRCTDCPNEATIIKPGIQCCDDCYKEAQSNKEEHTWDCKCVIHR